MITVPLQIRYTAAPQRETAAWLIPGRDACTWLAELLRWQVPLGDLALRIVPGGPSDLRPQGLLVVTPANCRPRVSTLCRPYGCAARRLYLPVEARFDPPVSETELSEQLGAEESVYLLHPTAGLVMFEPGDSMGVVGLLAAPPHRDGQWDRARPGFAFSKRLSAIEPERVPAVQEILLQGRDDIGSRDDRATGLPPSPDEPSEDILSRLGRGVRRALAKMVQRMTQKPPKKDQPPRPAGQQGQGAGSGAGLPGIAAGLAGLFGLGAGMAMWAQQQLARLDAALEARRQKAILRLLHMLETNPDEGLRFALPLAGEGHRGLAPPSADLGRRDVDFNLARLGGGGPADPWQIAAEHYQQLVARYNALAERELALGRHRRAAYIYGELLGNLDMAASALIAGRHWREAAVLYRERLKRPEEAARCLERGGLWTEAIALYEELGQWEKAGDLYTQLDQPDNAANAYRHAVVKCEATGDLLQAATLLETKLHAPDEALARLELGWPFSNQATRCLEESFLLLERLSRHEAAEAKVAQLRGQSLARERTLVLADILSQVATSYPHPPVRSAATDAVRVVAAEQLPAAPRMDKEKLLAAVSSLAPEDRLLARDCQRFLRPPPVRPVPRAEPPHKPAGKRPTLVREIAIPGDIRWQTFVSTGQTWYAAGYSDKSVVALRGNWEGYFQRVAWPWQSGAERTIMLAPDPAEREPLLVRVLDHRPLAPARFPASDQFPQPLGAGTPAWLPGDAWAAARSLFGVTWTLVRRNNAWLACAFAPGGEPIASRVLPTSVPVEMADLTLPIPFHVRPTGTFIGLGDKLCVLLENQNIQVIDLPEPVLGLAGSAWYSRMRLAILFAQGGTLFWADLGRSHQQPFAPSLAAPQAAFTRSGQLVVAGPSECRVFTTTEQRLQLESSMPLDNLQPIAVLPAAHPEQFALACERGPIRLYQSAPGS